MNDFLQSNVMQVHQAVIDAGEAETGCTIHQVTEEVDGGPIMVQKIVKVIQIISTSQFVNIVNHLG